VVFQHLFSITLIAIKRMVRNWGLTLCLIAGVAVTVAIAVGIPMYSSTVNARMLAEELQAAGRPPLSFMFWYLGSSAGPIEWETLAPLDAYMSGRLPATVGLTERLQVRYMSTDILRLYPAGDSPYEEQNQLLDYKSVGFVSGLERHIDVLEGRFPLAPGEAGGAVAAGTGPATPAPIEVLATLRQAEKIGLQVGEQYVLVYEKKDSRTGSTTKVQLPVRIAGIWKAKDAADPYWFYDPASFDDTFLVSESAYAQTVLPLLNHDTYNVVWYFILDGSKIKVEDISSLLSNVRYLKTRIASYSSSVTDALSPEEALRKYQHAAYNLVILLYVFSIPVMGLVLYFIMLISRMIVQRQGNEIALLRSRGSSSTQIVTIYLLENLLLGVIGAALGLLVGRLLAQLMGSTTSFLKFSFRQPVRVRESWQVLVFGLASAVLAVLAILAPAFSASRYTIITYKQERARSLRRPAWQRYFLDLFLLLPLGYGYYALWRRGTIALVEGSIVSGDPFSNPILFLVPTLFVLAAALLFLRLFPRLMAWAARLCEGLRGASLLLAMRSLARVSGQYAGPLLLLLLTTGLASFTASMARTLDRHIVQRAYYQTGGDFVLMERGELVGEEGGPAGAPGAAVAARAEEQAPFGSGEEEEPPHWEFVPAFEYAEIPGVHRVLRVGNYKAEARWSESSGQGHLMAVDPQEFEGVSSFRADYAPYPLSALTRLLSRQQSALVVDRKFFQRNSLRLGDRVKLSVYMLGEYHEIEFIVAGLLDYFPTAYPEEGPIFLANLEYLFAQAGGMYEYAIWLDSDPGLTEPLLQQRLYDRRLPASIYGDARQLILKEQQRPERQGFYGLLSVGFAGSALLTALSFLIYSFLSFQRRSIELGVLRAIGLSVRQMIGFLIGEQLSLVLMGAAMGTALGVAASYLFVPFLQVGSGKHPQTPPFVVCIAWLDVAWMLLLVLAMLAGVIAILIWLLMHLKIFQAVKLEEVT
jgi:putative ABC transport system permease protein